MATVPPAPDRDPGSGHPNNLHPRPHRASSGSGKPSAPRKCCPGAPAQTHNHGVPRCHHRFVTLSWERWGARRGTGIASWTPHSGHSAGACWALSSRQGPLGCSLPQPERVGRKRRDIEPQDRAWAQMLPRQWRALRLPTGLCPLSLLLSPPMAGDGVPSQSHSTIPIAQSGWWEPG